MQSQEIPLSGPDGAALTARLDLPEGPHLATALLVHCMPEPHDSLALRRIAGRLTAMGIAVVRLDMAGPGRTTARGAASACTIGADLVRAVAVDLAARDLPVSLLIGHAQGGVACLTAAPDIAGLRAVASLATPFDPVTDDDDSAPLLRGLAGMPGPLLILHGLRDTRVMIDNATRLFMAARHPKSLVTLDAADHRLQSATDADYAADVIASWAVRHLDLRPPAPPPGVPEGIVRVSEADPGGFLQDVVAGPRHHAQADEPLAYGGTDRGMSPYGFIAAGLGACTSMTIRMYARRKGWKLDHVRVDVSHDKMHAQDAKAGSGDRIDSFRRIIHLRGELTDAQRARLLEIADRCPVHRTLERASTIHTVLAG